PVNSLEEARKKLAALRGTGQDQPAIALASNVNDPRGKKHSLATAQPKHDGNKSVGSVTPPPMVRIVSPIPPAPSMKPSSSSSSSWFTYDNIPVGKTSSSSSSISQGDISPMSSRSYGRDSVGDARRPFNGSQEPRDPRESRSVSRDPREGRSGSRDPRESRSDSRDPRRDGHNPRDPRMGRNQAMPPYAGDPRRVTGSYNTNMDEPNHWQSNGNGNGNGNNNKYIKPNWGSNPNAANGNNNNNIPIIGYNNGSASSRGGYRGGSHNHGHYGRPNGAAPEAGHVPRTYREHKEAKARANAAAKAKLDEELRLLEAEKQRLLEAVEKETQLDKEKEDAAGPVPEPQLDTLYRNSTGASVKKIDFRIPKKAPQPVAATSPDGDVASVSPSKSCDADNNTCKTNNKDKDTDKDSEATKTSEKTKGKDKEKSEKSETKKHHKKADKKSRSSSKEKEKKRLEKEKVKDKEKDKEKKSDSDSVVSVASSENNENLENEPPVEEVFPAAPASALSEDPDEKLDALAVLRGGKKIPTLVNGEVMENGVESNAVDEAEDEKVEPPKLSKIKIVLGPNAHSQLLHNENSASPDNAKTATEEIKHLELFMDKHDDEEVPAPPMQELHRIMKRRYSMVPKASQPLVDKAEILTGGSLLYEDLQEQKRQSQRARHLAHIFEKTSDNCRISTQNIITGKRRTRGGGTEASFNETQLSRRSFGLGKINRGKRSEGTKATTRAPSPAAADVELSEQTTTPAAAAAPSPADVVSNDLAKAPEASTASQVPTRKRRRSEDETPPDAPTVVLPEEDQKLLPQPPPTRRYKRRPKRNELDKLNDDIAQMYNGQDVLRATGRRACTQRSRTPSVSRISPPPETNSSRSSRMSSPLIIRNVARRGKRFSGPSGGLNRASFHSQQMSRCVVRIQRMPSLEKMVKERPAKRRKLSERSSSAVDSKEIRNVNRDWHATSAATSTCVVCNANIRKSPLVHYIQNHGEHYGARLPPGMLDELRAGRNQRPDYRIAQGAVTIYYYKCPFCVKVVNMRSLNLAEHIITHTGERRYQCSHCLLSLHRLHIMQDHVKSCAPGATVLKHENCGVLPISLHVCHLCEFVQVSEEHMDWHLVKQHGLKEEELPGLEREQVLVCSTKGVPRVASLIEGQKIVERNASEDSNPKTGASKTKPKAAAKVSKKSSKSEDDEERPGTSKGARKKASPKKKVKIRFQNMAKKSLRRVKREKEDQTEEEEEKQDATQGELSEAEIRNIKALPLPPPEEDNLPVVNECLMDQDMEMELEELADEEQAMQAKDQSMLVEEKPLRMMQMDVDVDVDVENTDDDVPEPANQEPEKVTETPMETETPAEKTGTTEDISLSQLDADLLDGIGSDASDFEDDSKFEEPLTDEWIDLETAERNRKAPKNPFQAFTRFCSRLNKGSRANGRSRTSNASGSSNEDSHDSPDPSELMPRMRPLEPEVTPTPSTPTTITINTFTKAEKVTPPSQKSASPPAAVPRKTPLKRIENVAYRKGAVGGLGVAYYCIYPGCTFLFSNELEGLENHFAQEHPAVRWSGTCVMCPRSRKNPDPQPHSIASELRHMTEGHMARRRSITFEAMEVEAPVTEEPEPAPEEPLPEADPSPEQPIFKLRVRRFTGDRLAEPQSAEESQVAAEGEDQPNGMLRGLLQAEPRPPNQVDFNAAGLGEFLCAKPTTPPQGTVTSQSDISNDQPTVINYPSGLGLAISQVFTGASVPMPVLDCPSLVSLIRAPAAEPVAPPAPVALPVPAPLPVTSESSSRLVPDRFRCMASGCGFCSHTVMCIRQHMKFHSFSFGSNDYLKCAYCNHVATDVDDYVRHGIVVHSLAPNSDLHGIAVETPSVSQQIRDMLNQRGSVTVRSIPGQSSAGAGAGAGSAPSTPVDDKLYACPQKGCIVRLTEEQFVNHVRYHIRSSLNQGSEQVKCKYCAQTLLPPALRTHLQQAHARHKLFCSLCLATAANKRLMLYHVRSQHGQEFERVSRQLQFIQLPTEPDAGGNRGAGAAGGTAASALVADTQSVLLAAVVQPFGKPEMECFQRQLLEELLLRRQGTKTVYRGSEVRLLPRVSIFPQQIRCAECSFSSDVRSLLQRHLYEHRERIVREAYRVEENSSSQSAAAEAAEVDVVSIEDSDSTEATVTDPVQSLADPPPAVRPAGQHKAVVPRFVYVPTDNRYRCGFTRCISLLGTELELRQHMTIDHSYGEEIVCQHCKLPLTGQSSVDKYLAHLMLHKRHIYQCGACMRYNNKRSAIERHIQDRHPLQEVDVVIHRHSDTQLTTTARWLKSPRVARLTQMEFICNLCQISLPTAVQIMAHAVAVHDRKYQYHCPYCHVGNKDASEVIDHILSSHAGRRVQPVQIFQQISYKKSQTLGFYCIVCLKAANSCQRIGQHCEELHKSRFQWQCPHCDFGHQQERFVAQHVELTHPQRVGLAVMQFERVTNDIPDALSWELGQPIEEEEVVEAEKQEKQESQCKLQLQQQELQQQQPQQQQQSKQNELVVTEVVDLLASDDERDDTESGESQEERKIVEFACTHCGETNGNLQDLRTQHWAHAHPDQPFYFRVQPQLLCSECKRFRSNAKTLRDDHLLKVHSIRNIVACDVRRPEECAYCDYKYHNWQDLAQHISREGHLPNDLKNVTDDELAALQQLSASGGTDGTKNEYYQCDLCSVIMPTKGAIAQHGRVEHSKPGERFCFRQLTTPIIYHCFFCMFTSAEELTTLRHMVDHYNRFLYCHFCARHLPGGFDEYIQHCYTLHREEVHRFQELHSYGDLRKFLINVHYQFQNGLIITKSSLRRTRFNDERLMRVLYTELMSKVRRPPIRLHINLKSVQGQQAGSGQAQLPEPLRKITQRRKTLNPDELIRLSRQIQAPQLLPQAYVSTRSIIPPAATATATGSTPASTPAAVPPAVSVLRIVKRRNSYVVHTA
ncbi:hypothetical protein KR054_000120, partial [Drosophila jambulina]